MDIRNLILAVGLVVLTLASCVKKEIQAPEPAVTLKSATIQPGYNMVPNEILIKFKDGVDENSKSGVLGKITGKHKEKILTKAMEKGGDKQGINLVSITGTVDDALVVVKSLPEVEYAEPNYIYTNQDVLNDPYYIYQWGMFGAGTSPSNQYGSQAAVAWAAGHTGSDDVYVGIIDEGYMYNHKDLARNAGKNPGEIADNGIDDDNNGLIDDVHGWDFASNDSTVFDGMGDSHGTHVAGIIGAVGGNGNMVSGVCWHVKLLSAKFVVPLADGTYGGTLTNAIKAIDYFTKLRLSGVNIVATNNSWSGGGFSQFLQDAIERANQADILFIASAGNEGINTEPRTSYPSGYPNANIIAVASINSSGDLSAFSNYAPTKVDLAAPGEDILSTIPFDAGGGQFKSTLAFLSGTSMAAPFVTGAAALYASTHPGAKAADIKAAILDATIKTKSLNGKCKTHGRLNVRGF